MPEVATIKIVVEPFTPDSFAPFGVVLAKPERPADFEGNRSHSWDLPFRTDGTAKIAYSRFYRQAMKFSMLERHFNVTQGFVPLDATPFVMVVGPRTGRDALPAPDTLRAFYLDGAAGLLMHEGTWHTLDRFPVAAPHVDVLFLTAQETQDELVREKADGSVPVHTQVVDYRKEMGIEFEVTGSDRFAVTA
ncbi:MAG: ureidoglycolate lyase [Proteobacteria bacterium]|nr:ureidoglycolate lyase [Pseudomonadota bacterium]